MAVDILLGSDEQPDWAIVQGPLKVESSDFLLDAAARRGAGGPALRRALVHDEHDGLTINFNGDYPGGITLNGVAAITPLKVPAVGVPIPGRPGTLVVHGDISFETFERSVLNVPHHTTVSLTEKIKELEAKISELSARLTALHG